MTAEARLLTVKQVAARLSVSPRSVRRLIAAADLPVVRIGGSVRIRPEDLDVFIKKHTIGNAQESADS